MSLLARFWHDDTGATTIEYCLIAGSIAIAVVAGLTTIGTKINGYFGSVSGSLK